MLPRMRKRIVVWLNPNGALKLIFSTLAVLLAVIMLTYEIPSSKTWNNWRIPLSGKIIAIDAGHGGPDGGAESQDGGIIEKHINLAISLYLRDYLQQAGALVIMTREEDKDLADAKTKGLSRRKTEDLLNRVELIKTKKADMLVTIHLNSIPSTRWKGAQTFYYSKNKESRVLATFIQDELKKHLHTDRVAIKRDNVYLLKALQIPSSLVEIGFLSNPEEARLMADEKYQKKMAEAIYRGILRYYSGEKIAIPDQVY